MPGRREVYDQALRQGNSAAWDQKWEHAIAAYRRALEEFPGDGTALEHLGLAYVQNGQLDLALTSYQQASTADPSNPIPQEKIAEILERKGRSSEAVRGYIAAAELYLGRHEGEKAIDDWLAAARLAPENLLARSRLALALERTGRTLHAITEFLALAAILQKNKQRDKALQAIDQAIRLQPANQEVGRARAALQAGEALAVPPPLRLRGTAPLVPSKPAAAPAPSEEAGRKPEEEPPANPFEAAQLQALAILANLTFESSREPVVVRRAGLEEFDREPAGQESTSHNEVLVQLAKAIDSYARGSQQEACGSLERAIRAGCDYPAAHFMLGALRLALGEPARAVPTLERAVDSPELGMGAHYGLGFALCRLNQSYKAIGHYLAALRMADLRTVAAEQRDSLQRQYETFFEVDEKSQDAAKWQESCERIESLMSGVDWESRLRLARAQLDSQSDGQGVVPLAAMLSLGRPQELIEAMAHVESALRRGFMRTAMEEAMFALSHGPSYLPLHQRIAEIQLREGMQDAALQKLRVIARTYVVRGEKPEAGRVLERILQLNPMDIAARLELIKLLTSQGDLRGALSQSLDLGETYSQLADQENARQCYEGALQLARENRVDPSWQIQLLYRLGDLHLQRLDWRSALVSFSQLHQLDPSDERASTQVVELLLRLRRTAEAQSTLDSIVAEWNSQGRAEQVVTWLEELVRLRAETPMLRQKLAEIYLQRGRITEAVAQMDALGEIHLDAGHTKEAIAVVRAIVGLNPPGVEEYRTLLKKLEGAGGG
jgi:tetratricopeptide (TPR) repeat protein